MNRDVYLLETAEGYLAYQGARCYTKNPEQAIAFVDLDVAAEKCREFSLYNDMHCSLVHYRQPFPRPITITSHGPQVSKVSPRS